MRIVADLGVAKIEPERETENPSHEHQVATAHRGLSISDRRWLWPPGLALQRHRMIPGERCLSMPT